MSNSTGIGPQFHPDRLLFCEVAQTLVAEVRDESSEFKVYRLFTRTLADSAYTQIGQPGADIHFRSCIVARDRPIGYFMIWKSRSTRFHFVGEDWISIARLNLSDLTYSEIFSSKSVIVPSGYRKVWPVELISLSGREDVIYCNAAFQKADEAVEYWLCSLNLSDYTLDRLSPLEGIWL